ncbi:ESCRT-II subunit protein VPS36 [Sporobolomyces koalae]|uniref:ESCRT-II subunit protein VPS36 n=1 Tax=Sporobolomyces koalae TaxID=500713 RepID=UPI0031742D9B
MYRFTQLPSVTVSTVGAQLYPDEQLVTHQDGVGLYDGRDKSPSHDHGRIVLTSHRVMFIPTPPPTSTSTTTKTALPIALELELVKQTEYWTGFLKSSPKITLVLHPSSPRTSTPDSISTPTSRAPSRTSTVTAATRSWICRVCGMNNQPSLERGLECSLCGVKHDPASVPAAVSYPTLPTPVTNASMTTTVAAATTTTTRAKTTACPVCTFLNHHSMNRCEMCDTLLPSTTPPATVPSPSPVAASTSRPSTPSTTTSGDEFVRLSFRRGGINQFYAHLKDSLAKKLWQHGAPVHRSLAAASSSDETAQVVEPSKGGGIDAILRGIDLSSQTRTDSLTDAVKDLQSLMTKAKEMIHLAQSINAQISTSSTSTSTSQAAQTLANSSLTSLGLVQGRVVTSDQSRSEQEYHHSLARELANLLLPPRTISAPRTRNGTSSTTAGFVEEKGGIVGLDEVWCRWNRARGVALVSPKSFKSSIEYLPIYTDRKIQSLTFDAVDARGNPRKGTGLTILYDSDRSSPERIRDQMYRLIETKLEPSTDHDTDHAQDETNSGQSSRIVDRTGITVLEIARHTRLSLGIAKSLVGWIEIELGGIVRDSPAGSRGQGAGGEIRYDRDYITGFEWDGQ